MALRDSERDSLDDGMKILRQRRGATYRLWLGKHQPNPVIHPISREPNRLSPVDANRSVRTVLPSRTPTV